MRLNINIPVLVIAASTLWSVAQAADLEVDAELALAVDVSRSMTQNELEIQRRGYATALASNQVIAAITGGLLGRVAITYFEWAGDSSHRVIVDWKLVSNRIEAEAFASQLTATFDTSLRRTSISGALDFASSQFDRNGFTSNRRIIDVSGDGPNNQGRPVLAARADSVEKGIIVNGLPLMTREGMGSWFHLENLDEYYRNCVIAGPGSFVLPVTDWQQFPVAVRQKLVLELAFFPTDRLTNAALISNAQPDFDCMIGEKMWQQRWQYLDDQ